MVGKATPDRGGPRKTPDWVDPNIKRTRKTQRDGHNSRVKIWSLCSVSSTLSHANFEQPFRTLAIKWEVNTFLKMSSFDFFLASFIPALSLRRYIYVNNIYQFGACASRVLQGFRTNLVTVNDSFKHHNSTSTKRDREKWKNWKK